MRCVTYSNDAAPATEPVTLAEAKKHLRVDHANDDTYISALIMAAREHCEMYTRRAYVSRAVTALFDTFATRFDVREGARMYLPSPPVSAVTSVKYLDLDGVEQTLDAAKYVLHTEGGLPAFIVPAYGESWPTTRSDPRAVRVHFTAGYTTVPASLKAALLLIVGSLYENREEVITGTIATRLPFAAEALLLGLSVPEA